MRVLIDMDGVIADFEGGFLVHWRAKHPDKPCIPIEKRTTHFIVDQYPPEYRGLILNIFNAPGFFRSLLPVQGGVEALTEMQCHDIDVLICTSPLDKYRNCVLEKFEWIDEHFGGEWTKRTILTRDKTIVNADYLIDDMPTITGRDTPTWEHIVYDLPKNRFEQKKKRLTWKNWKDVMLSENRFRRAYFSQGAAKLAKKTGS